jgi:hypothetical protein
MSDGKSHTDSESSIYNKTASFLGEEPVSVTDNVTDNVTKILGEELIHVSRGRSLFML